MPRIRAELMDQGLRISRQRVARLMCVAGLREASRRRAFTVTTRRDERQRPAADLVNRKFTASGPDQLWAADMTYVPTWVGFIYVAVVVDVWSRKVVGWSIGEQMTSDRVLNALNMAAPRSSSTTATRGALYTSVAFRWASGLDEHGGRCLQQRHGRDLLRQPRMRADRPTQVQDTHRSTHGRPCSRGSRVGATLGDGTAGSATDHQRTSKGLSKPKDQHPNSRLSLSKPSLENQAHARPRK